MRKERRKQRRNRNTHTHTHTHTQAHTGTHRHTHTQWVWCVCGVHRYFFACVVCGGVWCMCAVYGCRVGVQAWVCVVRVGRDTQSGKGQHRGWGGGREGGRERGRGAEGQRGRGAEGQRGRGAERECMRVGRAFGWCGQRQRHRVRPKTTNSHGRPPEHLGGLVFF